MRITDLLDKRSISLTAAPKSKEEALNEAIALWLKAEKSTILKGIAGRYLQEKKRVQQV